MLSFVSSVGLSISCVLFPSHAFAQGLGSHAPTLETSSYSTTTDFKPATSDPEHALEKLILMMDEEQSFFEFSIRRLHTNSKFNTDHYKGLVTEPLQDAWANAEMKSVQKNCNGQYRDGELCGLSFNPLTCTQDISQKGYVFKTIATSKSQATITYKWVGHEEGIARYRLVHHAQHWKLDSVSCLLFQDIHFNTLP